MTLKQKGETLAFIRYHHLDRVLSPECMHGSDAPNPARIAPESEQSTIPNFAIPLTIFVPQ